MACEFLNNALEQVKGDISDKAAFMKALRSVNMPESPYGQVKLDQYGQPILDITIRKVEKKDGKLQNTVIKTYPAVGQFWTYGPDEFLEEPGLFARLDAGQVADLQIIRRPSEEIRMNFWVIQGLNGRLAFGSLLFDSRVRIFR